MGSLSFLQGIFPTQRWNPGLSQCRWILPAEPPGKPKNTGWVVAIPSPVDLPHPGIEPGFPALQADSLPTELSGNLGWGLKLGRAAGR